MKSAAAIPPPRSVILNAPFLVVHLTRGIVHHRRISSFLESAHRSAYFLRAVVADTYGQTRHRLAFGSEPGKFYGKMDIVREAVEIRRREMRRGREVCPRAWLSSDFTATLFVSLFATLFASKYINVYCPRPKFANRQNDENNPA